MWMVEGSGLESDRVPGRESPMPLKPELRITVFSDYICPFCYIGDARLNRLKDDYSLRVNWCFLEIHPDTPAEGMPVSGLGYEEATWNQMMLSLKAMAGEEQLPFREHDFTTSSHSALLLAEAVKRSAAEVFYTLHRRLFEALFVKGENIGDRDLLRLIARQAGVEQSLVERAWQDPQYEHHLKHYQRAAQDLNVRATPTFFIGERAGRVDGALPYRDLLRVIQAE